MGSDPSAVTINGKRYNIIGRVYSGSRGWEYQLCDPERPGLVARVCHAPPDRAGSIYTSGELLTFHP